MKQSKNARKQISQFSEWLAIQESENLMKMSPAPMNPHDPPNGGKNSIPSGLKIDIYGKKEE